MNIETPPNVSPAFHPAIPVTLPARVPLPPAGVPPAAPGTVPTTTAAFKPAGPEFVMAASPASRTVLYFEGLDYGVGIDTPSGTAMNVAVTGSPSQIAN